MSIFYIALILAGLAKVPLCFSIFIETFIVIQNYFSENKMGFLHFLFLMFCRINTTKS